MTGQKAL